MLDTKKSGYIVETKSGEIGRTFHKKQLVNGKVPVYIADKFSETEDFKIPISFKKDAILCDPATLKHKGFID